MQRCFGRQVNSAESTVTDPDLDSSVNPFAPTHSVNDDLRFTVRHPARWLLVTAGCFILLPVLAAVVMMSHPNTTMTRGLSFLVVYAALAFISLFLGLSRFTATNRMYKHRVWTVPWGDRPSAPLSRRTRRRHLVCCGLDVLVLQHNHVAIGSHSSDVFDQGNASWILGRAE